MKNENAGDWAWWCTPVASDIQEAEVGASRSKAGPDNVSRRPCLKNKLKAKGLVEWLKW
jgi:hypothetical protein